MFYIFEKACFRNDTLPKILLRYLEYCWVIRKQCRPRSDTEYLKAPYSKRNRYILSKKGLIN